MKNYEALSKEARVSELEAKCLIEIAKADKPFIKVEDVRAAMDEYILFALKSLVEQGKLFETKGQFTTSPEIDIAIEETAKKFYRVKNEHSPNVKTVRYLEEILELIPRFKYRDIIGNGTAIACLEKRTLGIRSLEVSKKGFFRVTAVQMPEGLKNLLVPIATKAREGANESIYIDFDHSNQDLINQVCQIIGEYK